MLKNLLDEFFQAHGEEFQFFARGAWLFGILDGGLFFKIMAEDETTMDKLRLSVNDKTIFQRSLILSSEDFINLFLGQRL